MDFIFEETHLEQNVLLQQFNELRDEYTVQEHNNDEPVDNCTKQREDDEFDEMEHDVFRFLKAYEQG